MTQMENLGSGTVMPANGIDEAEPIDNRESKMAADAYDNMQKYLDGTKSIFSFTFDFSYPDHELAFVNFQKIAKVNIDSTELPVIEIGQADFAGRPITFKVVDIAHKGSLLVRAKKQVLQEQDRSVINVLLYGVDVTKLGTTAVDYVPRHFH